jgi:cytidylate kinase
MSDTINVERCLSFIRTQLEPPTVMERAGEGAPGKLAITISRQTGTGGLAIAQTLAAYLQKRGPRRDKPWTVFDKNLVEEVLRQHNLPKDLAAYMTEERTSELQDMVEEVLGLHPSSWVLVRRVTETILNLAELGNVILVGRGANFVTSRLDHVFHVRMIGTLETRIERLRQFEKVSEKTARKLIEEGDENRRRYLRKYFKKDIDEPLHYDLVLNTDRISDETAMHLIAEAALARCA